MDKSLAARDIDRRDVRIGSMALRDSVGAGLRHICLLDELLF
jgi:hypothetical protein